MLISRSVLPVLNFLDERVMVLRQSRKTQNKPCCYELLVGASRVFFHVILACFSHEESMSEVNSGCCCCFAKNITSLTTVGFELQDQLQGRCNH